MKKAKQLKKLAKAAAKAAAGARDPELASNHLDLAGAFRAQEEVLKTQKRKKQKKKKKKK